MTDWASTTASAATAVGTLVLALSTFSAVRSAQRSARATEAALLANIRPLVIPAREDDPEQKVGFRDDHWVRVAGGRGSAEVTDGAIYLVIAVRNAGNGLAVFDRWNFTPGPQTEPPVDIAAFRRTTRDIYVPAGDIGFWQGALRDPSDPLFSTARKAIEERDTLTIDLLYGDTEGGQHTISRFALWPAANGAWISAVGRHWNLDRPDPR